jgi:hypothetical protein
MGKTAIKTLFDSIFVFLFFVFFKNYLHSLFCCLLLRLFAADEVETRRMSEDWKLLDDLVFNSPRCFLEK